MATRKSNNTGLLLIAVAGIGYLWYRSQQTAAAATPVTPPVSTTPALPVTNPTLQSGTSATIAPVSTAAVTTPNIPNGINATVYTTVQGWANAYPNNAGVQTFFANAIPSEFQTIYGLITVDWPTCGGRSCNSTSEATWNDLKAKYNW